MKNTLRFLITVILFTIFFSVSVFAQHRTLAQGNPPLTEETFARLTEMFEFSLDAQFSNQQLAEFKRQIIAQWKLENGAPESYTKLLEIYEKVQAMDENNQHQAQAQFQNALLGEIRKNPNNERNRLLMSVYNQSHGGDANEINANNSDNELPQVNRTGGNVPNELIGKWQAGSVSSTNYVNSTTGASSNGGGTQVMYTFFPDGRFEFASLYSLTSYSCTTNTMLYKTGHVEINGSSFTLVDENGKFTSEDNCNRQYNYEKPAKLDRETFNWSVQRDEYGTKLCLQNSRLNGCAYKR